MFLPLEPPVFVPLHPDHHAHEHTVLASAACSQIKDLIAYLQTLNPEEYIDAEGGGEGMGVVVRMYRNKLNGIKYLVIGGLSETEHKQLYPEAWLDNDTKPQ